RLAVAELQTAQAELEHRVDQRTKQLAEANNRLIIEVSERVEAEQEAERGRLFLETVTRNLTEALAVCDAKGRLVQVTPAYLEMMHQAHRQDGPEQWNEQYTIHDEGGQVIPDWRRLPLSIALRQQEAVMDRNFSILDHTGTERFFVASAVP